MTIKNEKTFRLAGVVKSANGSIKVRWANDLVTRIKVLSKSGCDDINFVELPHPMTKLESLNYLRLQPLERDAQQAVEYKYQEKLREHKKVILSRMG